MIEPQANKNLGKLGRKEQAEISSSALDREELGIWNFQVT